jgi:hypothetical protein
MLGMRMTARMRGRRKRLLRERMAQEATHWWVVPRRVPVT